MTNKTIEHRLKVAMDTLRGIADCRPRTLPVRYAASFVAFMDAMDAEAAKRKNPKKPLDSRRKTR
jgi:hypothetical protein